MQLFRSSRPFMVIAVLLPLLADGCRKAKPPPRPEEHVIVDTKVVVPAEGPFAVPFSLGEAHRVRIVATPVNPGKQPFNLEVLLPDDVRDFFLDRLDRIHPILKIENVPQVDQRTLIVAGQWNVALKNPGKQPLPLHIKVAALP